MRKKTTMWIGLLLCIALLCQACGASSGKNGSGDSSGKGSQSEAEQESGVGSTGSKSGAGKDGQAGTPQDDGTGKDSKDGQSPAGNVQDSSVIDFDEDPYEVTVELIIGRAGELQDEQKVEEAINAITLPKANLTVDLLPVLLAEHATKLSLWMTTGEKVDLVMAGMTTPFNNLVANESLQPITAHLKERAPQLVEKLGMLLDPVTVDGEVYAVPAILYPADSYVFYYNTDLAEQYGIEVPEKCESYEDIENVFKQVKESGMPARATNIGQGVPSSCVLFDSMGDATSMAYGVLMLDGSEEIVNYYDTDEYAALCRIRRDWFEKGYGVEDALTSGMNTSQMMKAGTIFGEFVREGAVNTMAFAESNVGVPLKKGLLGATWLANKHVLDYTWGVSINCERPDKCVDLLNLMYNDKDLMNLMANGIEGLNYVKVSDNIIDYPEGLTAATSGYAQLISKIGDSRLVYQFTPLTEDYYGEIDQYAAQNAQVVSPALGFTVDVSGLQSEIAAITNVVSEYKDSLAYGLVDVDETLAAFRAALKEAGMEKVIAETNRQFQEWKNR